MGKRKKMVMNVYTVMKMLGLPTKAFKAYFQWGPMIHEMTTATQRHNLWVDMNMKIKNNIFKYYKYIQIL